jgi:hypothetical protein
MATRVPSTAGANREPDEARREAFVGVYFETGNAVKSAQIVGIHKNTAHEWSKAPWFEKAIKELKRSLDKQMDGRITKILAKSLDALEDRIEKGDMKLLSTKDGIFREQVPVSARDLAVVTGVLFDKRAAIRKTPESDDDHAESALERIANKLRQYSLAESKDVLRDTAVQDVEVKQVDDDLC